MSILRTKSSQRKILPGLAVLFTVVLWASAFVGIRATLHDYPPHHLALLRVIASSIFLAALTLIRPVRLPAREDLPKIVLTGFLGTTFYIIAINYGELSVSAGAASFIVNTGPIITTILSVYMLNEQINGPIIFSMVTGFAGVGLISIGELTALSLNIGSMVILLAAISQSLYFVIQKPLLLKYSALELVSYSIWSGTLFLMVFSPDLINTVRIASNSATAAVIYIGIFPGAIGYVSWSYVLARFPASKATQFLYMVPIVAIIISYIWIEEIPSMISLVGGAIALVGVANLNFQKRRLANDNLESLS